MRGQCKLFCSRGHFQTKKNHLKNRGCRDCWQEVYKAKYKKDRQVQQYGISINQFNELFSIQEGRCAICNIHQSESKRVLFIDHDHTTGQVRSLLCVNCNSIIGFAQDNPELLEKAIDYLKNAQKRRPL